MLWLHLVFVFLLGAAVGSWLNVCVYRLPYEKSIAWPGSHCGQCYQPIPWFDNVPLLSYWLLGGRCRCCGSRYSIRYFAVELLTACLFTGLFWLIVIENILDLRVGWYGVRAVALGQIEPGLWAAFLFHALLLSLLLAASLCDLDHMEIPLSITMTGTVLGLLGSVLLPWPWPSSLPAAGPLDPNAPPPPLPSGIYPWPVWHPLPDWLPPGSWRLGLATGLAGAATGSILLRTIRYLFGLGRGMEGLGLGDADLMMMAGSFLGWQAVLVALFVGVFPALLLGIVQIVLRRGEAMPFGPSLAIGVLVALLGWRWIGRPYQIVFFDPLVLGALAVFGAVFLLAISFVLRLLRGRPDLDTEGEGAS
jgi:leader peptidase (prepilin peptidase)/N-methyltransferase